MQIKKNILFLTPDAVGSTFVERLTTICSQFYKFDKPVVNTGHIEIGLKKILDDNSNTIRLACAYDSEITYSQDPLEIIENLESLESYKISKLSAHNMIPRTDLNSENVKKLYKYLNDNFLIVLCRKKNLFDYALSWAISDVTGQSNVVSAVEKFSTLSLYHEEKISINPIKIKKVLDNYKFYVDWCNTNFNVDQVYEYETNIKDIENYIFSFPLFSNQTLITWKDKFGINFKDWNQCRYLATDITSLTHQKNNYFYNLIDAVHVKVDEPAILEKVSLINRSCINKYNEVSGYNWPSIETIDDFLRLPDSIQKECISDYNFQYYVDEYFYYKNMLENYTASMEFRNLNLPNIDENDLTPTAHKNFLIKHKEKYTNAMNFVESLDINIPIKKHTLADKKEIVKNFNECVECYNDWAIDNLDIASRISEHDIEKHISDERAFWLTY